MRDGAGVWGYNESKKLVKLREEQVVTRNEALQSG